MKKDVQTFPKYCRIILWIWKKAFPLVQKIHQRYSKPQQIQLSKMVLSNRKKPNKPPPPPSPQQLALSTQERFILKQLLSFSLLVFLLSVCSISGAPNLGCVLPPQRRSRYPAVPRLWRHSRRRRIPRTAASSGPQGGRRTTVRVECGGGGTPPAAGRCCPHCKRRSEWVSNCAGLTMTAHSTYI